MDAYLPQLFECPGRGLFVHPRKDPVNFSSGTAEKPSSETAGTSQVIRIAEVHFVASSSWMCESKLPMGELAEKRRFKYLRIRNAADPGCKRLNHNALQAITLSCVC